MNQMLRGIRSGMAALLLSPSVVLAKPTQEEVLRSINQHVGAEVDPRKVLGFFVTILALIVVAILMSQRQKRAVRPKTLNHPGRLTKEIAKAIELKPAELKQLKLMADERQLSSPLVLLLCPSLLSRPTQPAETAPAAPAEPVKTNG